MKEGTGQPLKKARTALMAAQCDIEAEAPDQVIARAYYATSAILAGFTLDNAHDAVKNAAFFLDAIEAFLIQVQICIKGLIRKEQNPMSI